LNYGYKTLLVGQVRMKIQLKTVVVLGAIGLLSCVLLSPQIQAAGPITGNITFAGTVNLDTASVNTATMVTAWHGLATGDKPQVQSRDGSFTAFVNPGDGTTFHAPWPFNSGAISNFWSVDNFTFDLLSSAIISQGSGSLHVAGTGTVSGNGFTPTAGTWNFTTQDPAADSQFSFSAASAVPEPGSFVLLAVGGASLLGRRLVGTKKTTA